MVFAIMEDVDFLLGLVPRLNLLFEIANPFGNTDSGYGFGKGQKHRLQKDL